MDMYTYTCAELSCVQRYRPTAAHTRIHTYIHTYIHSYIHSYIHTYLHQSSSKRQYRTIAAQAPADPATITLQICSDLLCNMYVCMKLQNAVYCYEMRVSVCSCIVYVYIYVTCTCIHTHILYSHACTDIQQLQEAVDCYEMCVCVCLCMCMFMHPIT
jgi:hypothetical protein